MNNTPEIIETEEVVSVEPDTFTRAELNAMIASANASVLDPTRKVSKQSVEEVIGRTYASTLGLSNKSRNFAIRKAVTSYIDLQTKGIVASATPNHFDLLPVAHPFSTAETIWKPEEIIKARAAWIAAEPGIAPEHRTMVASAYSQKPGTMEAMHAEFRIMALTAAGAIPARVAEYGQALVASVSTNANALTDYDEFEEYKTARYELSAVVRSQTALTASGKNLYDPKGSLARRIERGDSRSSIMAYLERSPRFVESLANMNADLSAADPYAQFAQEQFSLFYGMLENLPDAPRPVDYLGNAVEAVSKYDTDGALAQAITAGCGAQVVLRTLETNPEWNQAVENYNMDPESNSEFGAKYLSILDLDSLPQDYVPLSKVLPAK